MSWPQTVRVELFVHGAHGFFIGDFIPSKDKLWVSAQFYTHILPSSRALYRGCGDILMKTFTTKRFWRPRPKVCMWQLANAPAKVIWVGTKSLLAPYR